MTEVHETGQCSRAEMNLNIGLQALTVLIPGMVIWKNPRRLLALLLGWVVDLTILRRNTCMNCAYYGKECHLGWGLLTAKIFKRNGEGDIEKFKRGIPINTLYHIALLLMPIPWLRKHRVLLLLYQATITAFGLAIPFACRKCRMREECSLGKGVSRLFPAIGS